MIRVNWKHLAIGLAILPFAAVFVAWIGFFNVGASTGHWKITEWFLHFAMRSAVRTYSLAVDAPETLPREGVQAAAGHYARGCAVCHGAPGERRSAAVREMLPQPPDLQEVLAGDKWNDAELFRIVKHGVRFTGMPAWPTQNRDDEVWAMVAFLRNLPGMDAGTYRDLAYGHDRRPDPTGFHDDFDAALADCARCHGEDGMGRGEAVPILSGQRVDYLFAALEAYAADTRASGVMQLAASETDPRLYRRLAEHYAEMPRTGTDRDDADAALAARGREIARRGIPERDVPACVTCHDRPDRNPVFPSLDGQKRYYLEEQLRLFAEDKRGGTPFRELMAKVAKGLEEADIEALAAYFSGRSDTRR
ncbi:MAG: c-type cytochrome [Rhizobiaceae bacterium]|nr:c-type cytochrome [Rhizobiaceae bacterium]MCV0404835.1 c-type cytochrome [Rhizobiaceae bacterium]